MSRPPPLSRRGRGEVQGGDAEGCAELDDGLCAGAAGEHVEKPAGFAGDGEGEVLEAIVKSRYSVLLRMRRSWIGEDFGRQRGWSRRLGFGLGEKALEKGGVMSAECVGRCSGK